MKNKFTKPLQPGQLIARGVARNLRSLGYVSLEEFVPTRGLRVDIMALGPKGELWIIECKSSRADFNSDSKWENYLDWSDRFFWAVDEDFPTEILPAENGLIIADAYDADILRDGPLHTVATARRKSLIHKFATKAAERLHNFRDGEFTI
jgi:hypothetical protein